MAAKGGGARCDEGTSCGGAERATERGSSCDEREGGSAAREQRATEQASLALRADHCEPDARSAKRAYVEEPDVRASRRRHGPCHGRGASGAYGESDARREGRRAKRGEEEREAASACSTEAARRGARHGRDDWSGPTACVGFFVRRVADLSVGAAGDACGCGGVEDGGRDRWGVAGATDGAAPLCNPRGSGSCGVALPCRTGTLCVRHRHVLSTTTN